MTDTQEIGAHGEDIACIYLKQKGFVIVSRNYRRKWGEIDIVALKANVLHFVEVKTVAENGAEERSDWYRPEENVHPRKLKRLHRAIQSYLMEHDDEREWQVDVIAIRLNLYKREARCRFIENVIL